MKLSIPFLLLLMIVFTCCSSNVQLPDKVLGTWYEEKQENTLTKEKDYDLVTEKRNVIKFEYINQEAVVFGGIVAAIGDSPEKWSIAYKLKQLKPDVWSFKRDKETVVVTLMENDRLSAKGLVRRQQLDKFETDSKGKKIPKYKIVFPESIFIKN